MAQNDNAAIVEAVMEKNGEVVSLKRSAGGEETDKVKKTGTKNGKQVVGLGERRHTPALSIAYIDGKIQGAGCGKFTKLLTDPIIMAHVQECLLEDKEANGTLDWSEVAQLKWLPAKVPLTSGIYITGMKEWQLNEVLGSYLGVNAKKNSSPGSAFSPWLLQAFGCLYSLLCVRWHSWYLVPKMT